MSAKPVVLSLWRFVLINMTSGNTRKHDGIKSMNAAQADMTKETVNSGSG